MVFYLAIRRLPKKKHVQWKCEDVPSEKEKQNIEDFVKGSTENNVHLDDINMQDFVDDQSHSGAQLLKITFT